MSQGLEPSTTNSFELKDFLVRAGAGAGKTTNLTATVTRVAKDWFQQHGVWPRLVVTTFTRKATQELKERLVTEACRQKDFELLGFVTSPSLLQVSTLHGVFGQFLRQYSHLVGWDNGFTLLSEDQARRKARQLLRTLMDEKAGLSEWLGEFGFNHAVQMFREYSQARQIQALKACTEEDLAGFFIEEASSLQKSAFEVADILFEASTSEGWSAYAERLRSLAEAMSQCRDGAEMVALKEALGAKPRSGPKNPPLSADVDAALKEFLKELDQFKKPAYLASTWQVFAQKTQEFQEWADLFSEAYFTDKIKSGQFEMADLETACWRLIEQEPELAEAFADEWDYWLIDEYQDTSPLQERLLEHLKGSKKGYLVGDPQQSIYLFRGARLEVFEERASAVQKGAGKVLTLDVNYRSRPELLLFFNDLFQTSKSHFAPMKPSPHLAHDPERLVASFYKVERRKKVSDPCLENEAILHEVVRLLSTGERFDGICVLARQHKDLQSIAQTLEAHGVPTHVHAHTGFFSRREILDALALLKFLLNPHDNKNLIILLRTPYCRLEDQRLVEVLAGKDSRSHWLRLREQLDHPRLKDLERLLVTSKANGVIETFEQALIDFGFFDFTHHHDPTGRRESNLWKLLTYVRQQIKTPGFNLLELFMDDFSSDPDGQEESDAVAALEPNCVNLMTVHAAKGLKFEHVIVARAGAKPRLSQPAGRATGLMVDDGGIFSFALPIEEDGSSETSLFGLRYLQRLQQSELAEHDRLFYVALTRAVQTVCICWEDLPQKNSWIDRLQWDLEDGVHSSPQYRFEVSSGPWMTYDLNPTKSAAHTVRTAYEVAQSQTPDFQKMSVSEVLKGQEDNVRATTTSGLRRRIEAAAEGMLVHRLAELLKYHSWDEVAELGVAWLPQKREQVLRALHYMRDLNEPPLLTIIQAGEVEWGFQVATANGVLEGQIDLWGFDDTQKLWIVDYKSGHPDFAEKAFQQLQIYAQPLRKKHPTHEFWLAAVFPFYGQTLCRPLNP